MGQKVNPIGFRLAVNKAWSSKWYATPKDFPSMLKEDLDVRNYIKSINGFKKILYEMVDDKNKEKFDEINR